MFTAYSAGYRLVIHLEKAETDISFFKMAAKVKRERTLIITVIDQYLTFAIFLTLRISH